MTNKPKKWIAVLLGLLFTPAGMLYVGSAGLAVGYFVLTFAVAVAGFVHPAWKSVANVVSPICVIVGASHAYVLAKRYPEERSRPPYSRWYGILVAVVCVVVPVIGTRAFFFEPFRMPSSSMLPTLPMGAVMVVKKWGYGSYGTLGLRLARAPISAPLARADLIVFEFPQDRSVTFVKRLVGLPGDKVTYREGRLSINGDTVPQRSTGEYFDTHRDLYLSRHVESLSGNEYSVLTRGDFNVRWARQADFPFSEKCVHTAEEVTCDVPAGHYFVVGDNRDNSNDSRMWGFVPADHIVGKVVFVAS
ncbi:signal peptidase I [Roseateles sp. LYH14W]|uniref:Signal peptidase I n=1 Tax=Pelomonas parva TaxID=3299032 RepID=A0ABW7F1H7_9BURK